MIAPLRLPDPLAAEETRHLREARRVAAAALFGERGAPRARPERIAPWKAWVLALWAVAVTAAYFASMLRWP